MDISLTCTVCQAHTGIHHLEALPSLDELLVKAGHSPTCRLREGGIMVETGPRRYEVREKARKGKS